MNQKYAYLTVDDAPQKDFKLKVDYLFNKRIFAIFFCIGSLLEKKEKLAIYAIKKGFILGNHSYDHPHFSKISSEEGVNQIKKTDEILERIYKKANKKRPIRVFRFPYGDRGGKNKKRLQEVLTSLGYKQPRFEKIKNLFYLLRGFNKSKDIMWTFDIREWALNGKYYRKISSMGDVIKRIDNGLNTKSSSNEIILIHDHDTTTKYFRLLIEKLLDKKIKFIKPKLK